MSQSRVSPQTPSYVSEVLKYVPAHSDSSKYDSICHISELKMNCAHLLDMYMRKCIPHLGAVH